MTVFGVNCMPLPFLGPFPFFKSAFQGLTLFDYYWLGYSFFHIELNARRCFCFSPLALALGFDSGLPGSSSGLLDQLLGHGDEEVPLFLVKISVLIEGLV